MRLLFTPLAGLALSLCLAAVAAAESLAPGSPAPPFSLPGSDGESHGLEGRAVVLAWFPKAFTPG